MSRPPLTIRLIATLGLALVAASACARNSAESDVHAGHELPASVPGATAGAVGGADIPAGALDVAARLARSPRHGEWVTISSGPGDSVRAWVVYPERAGKAPVVVLVHEIFGLSTWMRGVADQFASDGFIAVAPDLLSGKARPEPGADTLTQAVATTAIRTLQREEVQRRVATAGQYGMSLPAAQRSYGVVGFCWGGTTSFVSALTSPPGQRAAVVFYGSSPTPAELARRALPVLGLYGGDDARVNATIAPADSAIRRAGGVFEPHVFPGAGHGFLRQQEGRNGANLAAAREAWPLAIAFFRAHLGR